MTLKPIFITLFFVSIFVSISLAQTCNNWLFTNAVGASVKIGDLDVSGNKITVEATFNRTLPWVGNYLYAGDLVSKHDLPNNVNYLLRPNNAEITTSNGYFATPQVCQIELNKTYHVALVYDGTTLKFYRNGFLMSQVAASGNLVNNNYITTIGDYAFPNPLGTNFRGFINEVRIWNVARSQNEIRSNMISSLSNPTTEPGLLAYYTFDNLLNKQGNATWNGVLNGSASINNTNTSCTLVTDSCNTFVNVPVVINNYTPVISLGLCKNDLIVSDATSFGIGDTVLIIQMQGADINITNSVNFGNVNSYNNAGNYEYNYISDINGNSITLLNNISRNYDLPNGKVQLVRVPYFDKLVVNNEITCLPWDGEKGGVIAFEVRDTLVLNADINASYYGFRGGLGLNTFTNSTNCGQVLFTYPNTSIFAAEKGESISLLNNSYNKGRGAPANAGGGGQDHNSGGGGGGNASSGGFGGYQWLDCSGFVDNRGFGGKPLTYNNTSNKIFLGGGGGAGHCNNIGFNSSGGNGGGIIIIKADKIVSNNNQIISDGQNGATCVQNGNFGYCHEGMGGGGAGGTVLLDVNNYVDNITIRSHGGRGANMNGENIGSLGPGGGGSGGVVWFSNNAIPTNVSTSLIGGLNGVNTNIGNAVNGATPGTNGVTVFNLAIPIDNTPFLQNIDSVRISRNQTSCTSFQFNAQGFTRSNPIIDWEWDFGDGNTSVSPNPTHTYATNGNFVVKLYGADVNGCIDSFAVALNIVQANVAASSNQQFCSNGSVSTSVSATGNGTIAWSPAILFNNPASSTPTVTVSNTTKLFVTSTLSPGCVATDSLIINVNPLPFTNISQSVCPAQLPFNWNSQSITSSGNYIAVLSSAAGCDSTVNLNFTIEDTLRSFNQLTICSNQAPLTWNSQSLTTSGIYRVELTNADNCDSVATLNLTINPISNSLTNETICSSQLPYNWNGQSIAASGSYQVVLLNSFGCDSTARLNLSLLPSSTSNTVQSICSNETPFTWNGQSYNNTGNYSVNLSAANGCDSIASLNLTVNPTRSSNTNTSICSGALPYNWNGQTLNTSGTYTSNLTSTNGCDSVATLQLQVNSIATSTTQRSICTAQLPFTWNGLTLNAAGSYTANLISQAGCDSLATIELQVGNSVTSSVSDEICNSSFPYSWNGLNIQAPGSYNATLINNSGCDSIITLTLSVKPTPTFNTISDTAICRGTTIRLTTTSGFTNYQWSPGSMVNDSTVSNPFYIGSNPSQMLIVSGTDVEGCVTSDTVWVTNRTLPLVTATPDTSACSNLPIVLSASGANTFLWSPSTYLSNPTINNPVFTSNTGMVYTVTGTDNFGCIGKDTVIVSIRTPNNLNSPPDKAMCKGQQVELDGANGLNYQYAWSPAINLSNSNSINPIASPISTTTYTVTIKDLLCGYERDFDVDVIVHPLPNVTVNKSNNINCSQKTARLTASGASQYQWQPNSTLSSTSIRNPIASPTVTTQYVVTGTDVRGCSNSDTITVTAMGVLEAYAIPNAFTPNGDGLNDCFGIRKWGDASNVYFTIYNRWGELVFETRDMNECWDGNYKGKQANAGNYVYYVMADTPCGKMNKKGNVILIR